MNTENVQSAEPTAVSASTESAAPVMGDSSASSSSDVATGGIDGLRKLAKDSGAGEGQFKPKSVDEALKDSAPPAAGAVETNQYKPNFKYKAALQEKEVDEFWRPLIKDAESEKRVIEALQRLDGFDSVKSSREKLNQEYQSLFNDFSEQNKLVQRVEKSLQSNDLSSAFRQLGVTNEQVFKWTQEQLQRMEMPPEQRKAYEEAEQLRAQQMDVQEQMSQYQRMYEDQAVQARTVHLDLVLSRQDVAKAAESWDSLMGEQGAFRNLVIQEAQNQWFQSQRDLSAEQAVQLVMQKFGKVMSGQASMMQSQPQAGVAQIQQPMTQPAPQAQQQKPVIPNINGKGTAPIKKVPKSLDDLKKMAKELQASE